MNAFLRFLIGDVVDKYSSNRALGLGTVTTGTPELGDLGMKAATSARDRKRYKSKVGQLSDVPTVFFDESFT